MKKIDKIIDYFRNLREEGMVVGTVPTNNVGGGKIAGTPESDPGNPPVFKKKRKKYIYQQGMRKWWRQNTQ